MQRESGAVVPGCSSHVGVDRVPIAQKYLLMGSSTGLRCPVPPESVAKSILFLASENWSSNITGQVLNVDSGKQGKVMWSKEESK